MLCQESKHGNSHVATAGRLRAVPRHANFPSAPSRHQLSLQLEATYRTASCTYLPVPTEPVTFTSGV